MHRRSFLGLSKAAGLVLAAVAALPAAAFWWRGSKASNDSEAGIWVDLGRPTKIPEGEWLARRFSFERRNRWRREIVEEMVYVHRDGRDLEVISPVCPHARCLVRPADHGFTCPCHRSAFDNQGVSLDGPTLRPLDALDWKVEKGRLIVHYQQFRPGVADREVVGV